MITYYVSLIFLWYTVTLYYCWRLVDYLPCEFDIFVVYCYIILLLETQWLLTMWVWYFCSIYTLHYITAGDSVITYHVSLIFLWYIHTLHYITAGDSVITYYVSLIFLWYTVTLYYCWRLDDYLPCEFDIFVVYNTRYIILLLETQWLLTMRVWYFCGIQLHYITAGDSVITYHVSLIFLWYTHVTLYYCWRLSDYLPCEFDIFVVYTLHYITAGDSVITYHVSLIFLWYIRYIILLLETQWLLTMWVWYFCGIYVTLYYCWSLGDYLPYNRSKWQGCLLNSSWIFSALSSICWYSVERKLVLFSWIASSWRKKKCDIWLCE